MTKLDEFTKNFIQSDESSLKFFEKIFSDIEPVINDPCVNRVVIESAPKIVTDLCMDQNSVLKEF